MRLAALAVAALAVTGFAVSTHAAPEQPFSNAAFKTAQAKGEPILVDAHASWCPTCRAQAPTIAAISRDPAFSRLVILTLDYDHQNDAKQALGIRKQSTLIAFAGSQERSRSVGVTDPAAIRTLAASALR
jgi:thiol-disulfide isomerase/thioredoxin